MQKTWYRFSSLVFCFRDEPSPAGEWHVHFLIGANGINGISFSDFAAALQDMWTTRFNRGTADIRMFDPERQLEGVCYVFKVIRDDKGDEIENPPVRSKALLNLIEKRERDNLLN
jgi:hypothetical protein